MESEIQQPEEHVDTVAGSGAELEWVSDLVVERLGQLGYEYIAINPGASYRGVHDSLVNHPAGQRIELLLCLHEEHAVSIAHGYANVTGKPLAVGLHSNVGLMHAAMALYNAWCDRVPMMVIGATGPLDATRRRPWIDWVHTAADQAALVRSFIKWDDQPTSPGAVQQALLGGDVLTRTAPCAPVYICLDAGLQESRIIEPVAEIEPGQYEPPGPPLPGPDLDRAVALLRGAERPVMLVGRSSRSAEAWEQRVRLAELLRADVVVDMKCGATFPSDHPQRVADPGAMLSAAGADAIRAADVVLDLDWVDFGGTLNQVFGARRPSCRIVSATQDDIVWNGWSKDHGGPYPADVRLRVPADVAVSAMVSALSDGAGGLTGEERNDHRNSERPPQYGSGDLTLEDLAAGLADALGEQKVSYVRLPLGWDGAWSHFEHPLDHLGSDIGGGLGAGPGLAVGAALALRDTELLPVAVLGDGDTAMGMAALWTAAHSRIPLLVIVANNRTYGNDEAHQTRVASTRGRPVENRWIGQRMTDPPVDYATVAKAQGWTGFGPIQDRAEMVRTIREASRLVRQGACVLVDVVVSPPLPEGAARAQARAGEERAGQDNGSGGR